jgi:hypothetical protein
MPLPPQQAWQMGFGTSMSTTSFGRPSFGMNNVAGQTSSSGNNQQLMAQLLSLVQALRNCFPPTAPTPPTQPTPDPINPPGSPTPLPTPGQPSPAPTPGQPSPTPINRLGAGQHVRVWGDPHFIGADGEKFDFHGQGKFMLLSDGKENDPNSLRFSGNFVPWKGNQALTVMDTAELKVGTVPAKINLDGTIEVNGQKITLDTNGGFHKVNESFGFLRNGNNISVNTPEYQLTFTLGDGFMNADAVAGSEGVLENGYLPTGALGITYQPGQQLQGATQEQINQYFNQFKIG